MYLVNRRCDKPTNQRTYANVTRETPTSSDNAASNRNGYSAYGQTRNTSYYDNVVYVMVYTGCNKEYIGKTGDFLRKRMNVHRQQKRDPNTRMLYVSEHIEMCAASNNPVNSKSILKTLL